MNAQIFIVSFRRDAEFLRYALHSINRFARGFSGTTVVVPEGQKSEFLFVEHLGATLSWFVEWTANGMMHHEDQIIHADQWCPGADLIVNMDSDCMFWDGVTPEDYIVDGRPVLFRERYDGVRNTLRLNWKRAVSEATGIDPEWETMVRHPGVFLPETHRRARERISSHTGMMPSSYIVGCRGDFPQGFAEFPTLGAVALEDHPEKYHIVDFSTETPDGGYEYQRGRDKMTAFWSHGGIESYRARCEGILK